MATENRSNNCKNQTSNRTSSQTTNSATNSATNEHKHPNQYTKGADDESAKNSTSSRSSNAKTAADAAFAPDGPRARTSDLSQIAKPAALRHCFPVRKAAGFRVFIFRWGRTAATVFQTARAHGSADRSDTASPAGTRSRWKHGIPPGKRALPRWPCWRCGPA